ncbi:hypothetical protein [Bacillus sp. Marseille-P3661]|uniref:hypothetical protein n=1 Tax=Bacillus sp. Marseille-P3661 TaxID=1936234 RepID=UPI000C83E091|nr:hypothetical protein [Bacillus sp. Marseille-P3661]
MGLQNIIDFILGNLFFLFLLISGLFSMFKRANQNKENTNDRRRSLPTGPLNIPNPFEINETEPARSLKPVDTASTELEGANSSVKNEETVNPYFEQLKRIQKSNNQVFDMDTGSGKSDKPKEKRSQLPAGHMKQTLNRKNVVNGFVWSQILSQPRARKKHTITGYYQKD